MKRTLLTSFVAVCSMLLMLNAGSASASVCTVAATFDPDAFLSDASACGLGVPGDDGLPTADVNALGLPGGSWTYIEKTHSQDPEAGNGTYLDFSLGRTGSWSLDTTGLHYEDYLIVMKGSHGASAESDWVWFVVDIAASGQGCAPGIELCGNWGMYGNDNNRRNLVHMQLFGRELAAPGVLSLVAAGFLALAAVRRR